MIDQESLDAYRLNHAWCGELPIATPSAYRPPIAAALIACYRRMVSPSCTIGSRRLFDAVNEAFCIAAHASHE